MELSATILSTRPLPEELKHQAAGAGIGIETIPFIETENITDSVTINSIRSNAGQNITAVFTSMNAVEAVAAAMETSTVNWKIFSMGFATSALVNKYFLHAEPGAARDASELADEIIAAGVPEVVFFCGDRRRPELPEKLKRAGIKVNEIPVYKTVAQDVQINKGYNGILFYSPSAVESFFSGNKLSSDVILFAIGNTTADAIRSFCDNRVIISDEPGKEALAKQAIEYFKSIRALH